MTVFPLLFFGRFLWNIISLGIIQLPFYGASQGSCILAWCIGRREDNMGPQSIILKDDSSLLYLRQGVQGIFYFYG